MDALYRLSKFHQTTKKYAYTSTTTSIWLNQNILKSISTTPIVTQCTHSRSIMCTIKTTHRRKFMRTLRDMLCFLHCRDSTQQSWHMVKQVQEKPLQWRVLNTIAMILKEALFQELLKKFSNTFRMDQMKAPPSWSE